MYTETELKAVHEKLFQRLSPSFKRQKTLLKKASINGPYISGDTKADMVEFQFTFRCESEVVNLFSLKDKPAPKNQMLSLVTGTNKRTVIGSLFAFYAAPYIEDDLSVVEIALEADAKNRWSVWIICTIHGSE